MKYYCVLKTIVNFENFIDTFDRLLRKIWKFWKFLIKFVKKINKNLNFLLHRGLLNKKFLGPFRPVRPAGLDFQARPVGRPARCHLYFVHYTRTL